MVQNKEVRLFILTTKEHAILDELSRQTACSIQELVGCQLFLQNINCNFVKISNIKRIINILLDHKLISFRYQLNSQNRRVKKYYIIDRGYQYLIAYYQYKTRLESIFPNRIEVIQ